jgi:ADP-heptose:LPS heptosyltransferase
MNPAHILILKPSSLGDIVHTLPAVAAIRSKFPASRISWMVNPEWAPLLEGNPHINETIIFPRGDFRGPAGWLRFNRWRLELREKLHPDLILDFQGLLRTALLGRTFRGVPFYGLSDAREGARFLQTRTIKVNPHAHAVERYLAMAAALGADVNGVPRFDLPPGKSPEALLPDVPWILFHPFSRGRGKSLAPADALAFCRSVGHPVVLVGRAEVNFPSVPANIVNLLNQTTLPELIWLLHRAAFVVSVDSGPMHLAAAITDRLLGLHTWSDPCKVGPYRIGAHVWKGQNFYPALDPASSDAPAIAPDATDLATIARWVQSRI